MNKHVWYERTLPDDIMAMLDGVATRLGPGIATPDDPLSAIGPAHAAVAGGYRYNAALFDRAPNLLAVVRTGIGYDGVDVDEATRRGIAVCNTPDGPTISTAEHTWALLMAVAKKLKKIDDDLHQSRIGPNYHGENNALELYGTTLGLVGLGRIGGRVARIAQAFGMSVLAYDPMINDQAAAEMGVTRVASLDALLPQADIVSLHLPLVPDTRRLMNAARFAHMKKGALFVNAARGGLVDESALLAALESGHLGGAGLDVTDPEPPKLDNPLVHRKDVYITPHIASATVVGLRRMQTRAMEQVADLMAGRRPEHLVNPEVWPAVAARYAALLK